MGQASDKLRVPPDACKEVPARLPGSLCAVAGRFHRGAFRVLERVRGRTPIALLHSTRFTRTLGPVFEQSGLPTADGCTHMQWLQAQTEDPAFSRSGS